MCNKENLQKRSDTKIKKGGIEVYYLANIYCDYFATYV